MLDIRVRAFIIAVYFAILPAFTKGHAQEHKVTLVGQLFQSGNGECEFFLDPEGDSLSITFSAAPGEYLCDYWKGSETHRFIVTMGPAEK